MIFIDVSKNNGTIDWDRVVLNPNKPNGVFIKATEGIGYIDPKLEDNASEAKRVGLKVGYYHFCSLNDKDVIKDSTAEANCFLKAIEGLPLDLPLVLDIERGTKGVVLDKKSFLDWIDNFFFTIKKANKDYMLYSGTYFLNDNLPEIHGLGNTKLWLAQYTYDINKKPILPKGWKSYTYWQWSDKGQIMGIKGNVDLNISI